ncbi:MAG: cysteine synthase A [Myxococcales bacterium]|nr:cysteine synthase A [Myxococcota bacterium]MDW8284437.1 cysteine synthase A [Myxococcales bacterium]
MPQPPLVVTSLLELIGGTPLVRLRRMVPPGSATILGKCEQYNPGGSVKDRIALAMIEDAERRGAIRPGHSIIVEPTSGNTGIGLALVCAVKGYRLQLTMPESMSLERRSLLAAYGAELVLTPAALDMAGAVERAEQLVRSDSRCYMPQQFRNPANPEVHRRTTGPELVAQLQALGRRPDAFVVGVGTGGTLTGVGQVLRQAFPEVRIIAVEPAASAVLSGGRPGLHRIQGIGAGFVPEILDRSLIDEVRVVTDREANDTKVRLARQEGLLVGISSGAAVHVALAVAAELGEGRCVVTVLCDTGERYFSLDEFFE